MKNQIWNALMADLLENMPAIMAFRGLDDNIKWANKACRKATGLSLEEITGKTCVSASALAKLCRNCPDTVIIKTGELYETDMNPQNKGDESAPLTPWVARSAPIMDENDKIIGMIEVIFESINRKDSELAIQRSEARLREAQRLTHIGHWELDFKTNELFWSDEIYRIFEIELSNFTVSYEAFLDIIHPNDREQVNTAYKESIKNRESYSIDHRLLMKDDRVKYVREQCKTYYDDQGNPIRSLGTVQDITEQKQVEDENKKLQEQFLQVQKMESIGRLAGGVAHDFNNMLSVIIGHVDLALEQIEVTEPLHNDLLEIYNASKRSADLTRQLLAFARKQVISPQPLDLNEIIGNILNLLRRLIGEDIDLVWIPGTDLGVVNMDPSQIDQILANLCVNARDAITGVGKITIETDNASFDEAYCNQHYGFLPGSYVMVAVSDNGSGIKKEILNQLFEPFFTTKELGKGTGLGLATVHGIVKQNDGFINVYSELYEGTTFKIYLPRQKICEDSSRIEAVSQTPQGGGETILLVEDEIMILNVSERVLKTLSYEVLAAKSPFEALSLAKEHRGPIDLLITDVVMPEMNGRDLSLQLQLIKPKLKTLYMSGYTANVIANHGILEEGVKFIQKPFSKIELATKIREVISQK